MGRRHLRAYEALARVGAKGFDVTVVCDPLRAAAEEAADLAEELLGARPAVFSEHEELIASGPVEALDVVTDSATHHLVAVPALAAGLHVICEKPLGITVRACRAILDAAVHPVPCWRRPRTTAGTGRTASLGRCSSRACSARCTS